jgi:hypothetical protein
MVLAPLTLGLYVPAHFYHLDLQLDILLIAVNVKMVQTHANTGAGLQFETVAKYNWTLKPAMSIRL